MIKYNSCSYILEDNRRKKLGTLSQITFFHVFDNVVLHDNFWLLVVLRVFPPYEFFLQTAYNAIK